MCMFNCDARACYNQMILSQCLNQGARISVHEGPIKLHLKVSQNMKYHIKMAYGVSKAYFATTLLFTIFGMMQGSAAIGAFWGLMLSLLPTCLSKQHKPMRFPCSPQECVYTGQNGEAFVDDTTLWLLVMTRMLASLVLQMTHMVQMWECLLWTSLCWCPGPQEMLLVSYIMEMDQDQGTEGSYDLWHTRT